MYVKEVRICNTIKVFENFTCVTLFLATHHKTLTMFCPDKYIEVLTNSASQVLPFWSLSDANSFIHIWDKCRFWQSVSAFLTFCCSVYLEPLGRQRASASMCAWRRAWLRHHLIPLFSFVFHALCMSFLFLSDQKLQNTTAFFSFFSFNCYVNSTNVLISVFH